MAVRLDGGHPEESFVSKPISVGVIGCGYWGPNVIRNFFEAPGAEVVACCDTDARRLESIRQRFPSVRTVRNPQALFADPRIDAVAIVTPLATHYALAAAALRAGKHVFLEKPATATAEQAARLLDLSRRRRKTLFVDHVFVYTSAVRKMRELVSRGRIGRLYYVDSVRINLGPYRHDTNAIWDLAIHDIAIPDYLLGKMPKTVSVLGASYLKRKSEDIAYVSLGYDDGVMAHLHVNWLAPVKVRTMILGGSQRMIIYDDVEVSEKVKVYDKGIDVSQHPEQLHRSLISYRVGDMYAPKLESVEALQVAVRHFLDCVRTGRAPLTGGEAALRVLRVLEAAQRSLRRGGRLERIAVH